MLEPGAPPVETVVTTEPVVPVEPVAPVAPVAPVSSEMSWDQIKAMIPEGLRADKSMEVITSLEGLTSSYINAQKSMGKDKIAVPDKHATAEDWQHVYQKLGNPEKLEDYKVTLEGETIDDAVLDQVKAAAHESGILPWQFEKIVNTFNKLGGESLESSNAAAQAAYNEEVESLKKEWGESYDVQLRKANVAFKEFLPGQEDRDAFIKSGLGDNPRIVKMLANAAALLSEDTFLGHGDGNLGGMTPAEALDSAQKIQGDPGHPYRNPSHPNHKSAKEEVANYYKIAYPQN